ncbi:MAG TPA: hypothetical protein VGO31_10385 [Microbacteriaceae bacterium]|nr:hypothetical protein [Microbacteriaceae bacterium]
MSLLRSGQVDPERRYCINLLQQVPQQLFLDKNKRALDLRASLRHAANCAADGSWSTD